MTGGEVDEGVSMLNGKKGGGKGVDDGVDGDGDGDRDRDVDMDGDKGRSSVKGRVGKPSEGVLDKGREEWIRQIERRKGMCPPSLSKGLTTTVSLCPKSPHPLCFQKSEIL